MYYSKNNEERLVARCATSLLDLPPTLVECQAFEESGVPPVRLFPRDKQGVYVCPHEDTSLPG